MDVATRATGGPRPGRGVGRTARDQHPVPPGFESSNSDVHRDWHAMARASVHAHVSRPASNRFSMPHARRREDLHAGEGQLRRVAL